MCDINVCLTSLDDIHVKHFVEMCKTQQLDIKLTQFYTHLDYIALKADVWTSDWKI